MATDPGVLALVLGLFVVALLLVHKVGRYVVEDRSHASRTRDAFDILILFAVPTAALVVYLAWAAPWLAVAGPYPVMLLAGEIAALLVPMILFPILYVRWRDGWTMRDLGLTSRVANPRVWAIAIGFGVLYSVLTAAGALPAPVLFLALSVWQPAIAEELFARGILQTKLIRAAGLRSGLLLACILFAGLHLAGDLAGVSFLGAVGVDAVTLGANFAFRGVAGLLLGLVYVKTRSLVPGIVLHYLLDFGGATLAWGL